MWAPWAQTVRWLGVATRATLQTRSSPPPAPMQQPVVRSRCSPQASLAAILAMGKPVALEASAEERLQGSRSET